MVGNSPSGGQWTLFAWDKSSHHHKSRQDSLYSPVHHQVPHASAKCSTERISLAKGGSSVSSVHHRTVPFQDTSDTLMPTNVQYSGSLLMSVIVEHDVE